MLSQSAETSEWAAETSDWAAETEARLLQAAVRLAPRLGWSDRLVVAAGREIGLSAPEAQLLLPDGARDLAALFSRAHDAAAAERLAPLDPASLKIRERIRHGVIARCDVAFEDAEALRRCTGFLALPRHILLALRLAWASADQIWRWAGDVATDENHYTKRLLLAEILISTVAVRLAHGGNAAQAHVDRRIAAVMAFEKWKAGLKPSLAPAGLLRRLTRLRYGAAAA